MRKVPLLHYYTRLLFMLIVFCNLFDCGVQKTFYYKKFINEAPNSYPKYDNFLNNEATKFLCVAFGICSTFYPEPVYSQVPDFAVVNEWPFLDFDYPNEAQRNEDIRNERFTIGAGTPIDVDVHYSRGDGSRIFVTVPRFRQDIPASLGVVSRKTRGNSTLITPYPSWEWHQQPIKCKKDRIVSVFRIKIDECNRLWVLDTGHFGDAAVCPAQILAFDLHTNTLVHRYEIPANQLETRSLLVTIQADVRDQCENTFIYAGDCQAYSLIVHDVQEKTSWRVTDQTMYPFPPYGTFRILGDTFHLMDGVLGMALSPFVRGKDRKLFYHAMSSPTENWVWTSDLRNGTRFATDPSSSPDIFHTYKGQRSTQSAAEAIDKDGIMYFGLMSEVTMNCWNTITDYEPRNWDAIGKNQKILQFASGVKVVVNPKTTQELWVLTSRFQKVAANTLSLGESNFRVLAAKVDDLIFTTKCNKKPHHRGGGYGLLKP